MGVSAFDHSNFAYLPTIYFVSCHPELVRFIFMYCSILLLGFRYFIFFPTFTGSVVTVMSCLLTGSFSFDLISWIVLFILSSLSRELFLWEDLLGLLIYIVLFISYFYLTSSYFYFCFCFFSSSFCFFSLSISSFFFTASSFTLLSSYNFLLISSFSLDLSFFFLSSFRVLEWLSLLDC